MNESFSIEVRGLRKTYGEREAVRGIDFTVRRGEVYAMLGPNGAGKTTTVEILEGYRERTSGEVSVLGFDPGKGERSFRERVGIVLQETSVDPYLKVEETIELYRGYYPHPRPLDDVIQLVGLTEQRGTRVRRLSGGQQRRLDVAIGLCGDPDLLFLDEPTTGFDPAARRDAWEMIRSLQNLGKTIFLTTHYMDEAEHLADRVAIVRRGEIIAEGAPDQLISTDPTTTLRFGLPAGAEDVIAGLEGIRRGADGFYVIETEAPTAVLYELTRRATGRSVELFELTVSRPTLEDTYLRLVEGEEGA
ncbi:MAG: ABC transporter ATP-binding protein [Dehalococcoidia bacterium]